MLNLVRLFYKFGFLAVSIMDLGNDKKNPIVSKVLRLPYVSCFLYCTCLEIRGFLSTRTQYMLSSKRKGLPHGIPLTLKGARSHFSVIC